MKSFFLIALSIIVLKINAQQPTFKIIPDVDSIVTCLENIHPLTYEYDINTDTNINIYSVSQIDFEPVQITGTTVNLSDDDKSSAIPIGFSFNFWGNLYNNFYIYSNGFINFDNNSSTSYFVSQFPNELTQFPNIFGAFCDLHPGIGGQVSYATLGNEPNRKLVVEWKEVPLFSCTNQKVTFQIILNETTNFIDVHITLKPSCLTWMNGVASQAITFGNNFIISSNRNATIWEASNDAVRFSPGNLPNQIKWFINGIPAGNSQMINGFVTNGNPIRQYVARFQQGNSQAFYYDTLMLCLGQNILSINANSPICDIDSFSTVQYTGSSYWNLPLIWDFDDGIILNGTNGEGIGPHHVTWLTSGNKMITVSETSPYGCGINTKLKQVSFSNPQVPFVMFSEDEAKLYTGNFLNYQWYWNGNIINDATQPYYYPTENGFYKVVTRDSMGCQAESEELEVLTIGIETIKSNIKVYPNPTNGLIKIEIVQFNSSEFKVSILNPLGQVIASNTFNDNQFTLDLSMFNIKNGIYIIKIESNSLLLQTKILLTN